MLLCNKASVVYSQFMLMPLQTQVSWKGFNRRTSGIKSWGLLFTYNDIVMDLYSAFRSEDTEALNAVTGGLMSLNSWV